MNLDKLGLLSIEILLGLLILLNPGDTTYGLSKFTLFYGLSLDFLFVNAYSLPEDGWFEEWEDFDLES